MSDEAVGLYEQIRQAAKAEVYARYPSATETECDESIHRQAEVLFETFKRTASLRTLADRSLRWQAVHIAASGLWAYTPGEYASPEEFISEALAAVWGDEPQESSTYHDLMSTVKIVQYAKAEGIEGVDALWTDNRVGNTRVAIPYLNALMQQSEAHAQFQQTVRDVLALNHADFREKYPTSPRSGLPVMPGWKYVLPDGRWYLVVEGQSEVQYQFALRALGNKLSEHHGTGQEEFLFALQRRKI